MQKIFTYLANNVWKVIVIYVIVQLLLVVFGAVPFYSDSLYYYHLAQSSISNHSFYPAPIHLYEDYITAPLYINILIAALTIYNSQITIGILNIILNCLQLFFIFKLTENFFGKHAARISVLIYIFYLSTLGMVLMNLTEFIFGVLILASIYFFYKDDFISYFSSGIIAAASVGVRPIGWALVLSYLIVLGIRSVKDKANYKKIFLVVIGCAVFIIPFGLFTRSYFNRFIFTNTNGPVNILIGANNDATGAYNAKVFEKGKAGFIDNPASKTYIEKEAYWKVQAVKWIEAHPLKWISLFPLKIIHMFAWDDYSISTLFHMGDWNLYKILKTILVQKNFSLNIEKPFYSVITYFVVQIVHHIYYFSMLFIFLVTVVQKKISILFNKDYLPVTLFVMFGLMMNLVTFGDARFKYPYMLFIIIAIAPAVLNFIKQSKLFSK